MENRAKKWVVAVLFAVLFACVAAFSLGVVVFNNTRARAAEASPKRDYETISVEYSLIYASDTSSELIKDHLTVYGTAADVEGEVKLERGEYTVYLGDESGSTEGWTLSVGSRYTFTVVAGSAETTFSATVQAVALDSQSKSTVRVNCAFTVENGANFKDGEPLALYDFKNVSDYITVTIYTNDGRPYKEVGIDGVISPDEYTFIGNENLDGEQSIAVRWTYEGITYDSEDFSVVLSEDFVTELKVKNADSITVNSNSYVNATTFAALEVEAVWASDSDGVGEPVDVTSLDFSGNILHDEGTDPTFTETITISYEGKTATFNVQVNRVDVTTIVMSADAIVRSAVASQVLDTTPIFLTIMYGTGSVKMLNGLGAEYFDIVYINGKTGERHTDMFKVGDTKVEISFTDSGKKQTVTVEGFNVSKMTVNGPTFVAAKLTYTGEPLTQSLASGFDAEIMYIAEQEGMTVNGATVQVTSAGPYTFRLYLKDSANYVWAGQPQGASGINIEEGYIEYTFSVEKKSLSGMSLALKISDWVYGKYDYAENGPYLEGLPEGIEQSDVEFYFYGTSNDGNFDFSYDQAKILSAEEIAALGVGSNYGVFAFIKETENYKDFEVASTSFSVTKQTLETPDSAKLNQIYIGTPQQANTEGLFGYGDIFTMKCEPKTDVARDYSVTFTITEEHFSNYQWKGGSQSIELTWDITKAMPSIEVSVENWTYSQLPSSPSTTVKFDGKINENIDYTVKYVYWFDVNKDKSYTKEMSGAPSSNWAAGLYKVVATISETSNYKEAEGYSTSVECKNKQN